MDLINNKKNKKILLIIPTLAKGGAERVVSILSFDLKQKGYEVVIVVFDNKVEYKFGGRLISLNIKQYKSRYLRKIVNTFVPIFKLRKIFKKEKPDKIISFLNNIASILTNYPVFVSIHTSYDRLSFLDKWALKTIYNLRNVKSIIVPSSNLKKILESHSSLKKIVLIHNPVDAKNIEILIKDTTNYDFSDYIIAMGRLDPVKNFDFLINAFAASSLYDNKTLLILGEGKEKVHLEKLIKKLKLLNVKLLGQIDNPFPLIRNARFLALTSQKEVFPNVLIESLACGTPVLSVDCDFGPREIIKNNYNGLLISTHDVNSFAQAMEKLYCNDDLYINIKKNCEESVKIFSSELIIKKWESLLFKDEN